MDMCLMVPWNKDGSKVLADRDYTLIGQLHRGRWAVEVGVMRTAARVGMFADGIGFEVGIGECKLGAGEMDCSTEVGCKMAVRFGEKIGELGGFGVGFGDFGQCM